jgi:O-antigen ligase/polysaccharide polymerase Wzy-like membrane protein
MAMLIRLLRDAPRWVFLTALIYAPWAYGCTTAWSIIWLDYILASVLALWILPLFIRGRRPIVPRFLLLLGALLLLQGWWMVFNAKTIYDSSYLVFVPLSHFGIGKPGSVDYAISAAWMVRATMLLGVIFLVSDLSLRPAWLLRLWWTLALGGASIALLGLLQKATNAEMIFWQHARVADVRTFFATYYYHGNAGAFLNLVLPPTFGLALRTLTRATAPIVRALWLSAALILCAAIFANTSRMAQLIAALLIIVFLIGSRKTVLQRVQHMERRFVIASILVVVMMLLAIAQASHLDQPLGRWQMLSEHVPENARWFAWQAALPGVHEAGWLGFGPGTFRVIFPCYTRELGDRVPGIWRFLHEDYLQTLMEWGWAGGTLWALVFFGGIATGIRSIRQQEEFRRAAEINSRNRLSGACSQQGSCSRKRGTWEWTQRRRLLLPLSLLALLGVAAHALVDFPLQIASIQLYAATLLGICWGSGGWSNTEPPLEAKT